MPLVECKECKKEISDQAAACPHCGSPTDAGKKEKSKKRGNTQGIGCLLIIVAGLLAVTAIGTPVAILVGAIGIVILIVGLVMR